MSVVQCKARGGGAGARVRAGGGAREAAAAGAAQAWRARSPAPCFLCTRGRLSFLQIHTIAGD